MKPSTPLLRLSDLPLWRLIVALDDAERVAGADSSTVRTLARELQRRLSAGRPSDEVRRSNPVKEDTRG